MTVWYRDQRVGELKPNQNGDFLFSYDDAWINGKDSFPISLSLPLGTSIDQNRANAFFSNLLPEGPGKEQLCRQLGISLDNRYETLKAIGRDCAGALMIGNHPGGEGAPRYQAFRAGELDNLVQNRPALPVLEDGEYVRFSLAGSVSKWAVVYHDETFLWPQGSTPSSHIIKAYDPRFSHASFNEAFTAFIAARLGLTVAVAKPAQDYLLIERYDRTWENGKPVRLHQEDAAQALGIPPFRKYQREGGAGIAHVIELIRTHSWNPLQDQKSLITWQLTNLILGNADGHLKNISFLYDGPRLGLAPFYDMVCTRNYDGVERKLALDIGDGRDPGHIGREQLRIFAQETHIAERYIFGELDRIIGDLEERIDDYAHEFVALWGDNPVTHRIRRVVLTQIRRTKTLLRR